MIVITPGQTIEQYFEGLFEKYLDKEYDEPPITGGGGRTYLTPRDMAKVAIEYFVGRYATGLPPTMESMRVYMRFWTREAFYKYKHQVKQYQPDFAEIVDLIRNIIESEVADGLFNKATFNGSKFVLQCGFKEDWIPTERQIVENHDIKISIGKKDEEEE